MQSDFYLPKAGQTDILGYMGIDSGHLFRGFKGVLQEANYIDSI
jgi:hypothetical protein